MYYKKLNLLCLEDRVKVEREEFTIPIMKKEEKGKMKEAKDNTEAVQDINNRG